MQVTDFDDFVRAYCARRLRTTGKAPSPETVRGKRIHLNTVAKILGATDQESLSNLLASRRQVETLLDGLALRMSPGATRTVLYAVADFCRFAEGRWGHEHALVPSDMPGRNPQPAITVYSAAELERFLAAARGQGLRWWAFLATLADSGRRVSEILGLRWEHLRLDEVPAYFELPTTKNGHPQYAPLTKRLRLEVFTLDHIVKMKAETRPWNRSPREHPFPWTYSAAKGRFDRFCELTGLPNRGFHNFRHTYATGLLARGVPIQAVAALLGHESVATTDKMYNHTEALSYAHYLDVG